MKINLGEHIANLCNFDKIWSILKQFKKTSEIQYRILKNRTFKRQTVYFTGLPFRNQEIENNCPNIEKNGQQYKCFNKFVKN